MPNETGFRQPPRPRKRGVTPPAKENAEQRFKRVAESRLNKVLKALRTLGGLGNPVYHPDPGMIAIMHQEIMREADRAFARLDGRNLGVGFRFKQ